MEIVKLPENKFIGKNNGETVEITEMRLNGNGWVFTYVYEGREDKCELYEDDFLKYFKPLSNEVKSTNLNQDIIKLIESGYNFKSFSATTTDGRYVSVDLEEAL